MATVSSAHSGREQRGMGPLAPQPEVPAIAAMDSRPFRGGFRDASWNSQALFSPDPVRQEAKRRVMTDLAATHDFVMLQETHSTQGVLAGWTVPAGFRYFHLHGTTHRNGVGILVSLNFLAQFDTPPTMNLEEVVPERVGALRLQGRQGRLDIFTVYADSGNSGEAAEAWMHLREALGRAIGPHGGGKQLEQRCFGRGSLQRGSVPVDGRMAGGRGRPLPDSGGETARDDRVRAARVDQLQ